MTNRVGHPRPPLQVSQRMKLLAAEVESYERDIWPDGLPDGTKGVLVRIGGGKPVHRYFTTPEEAGQLAAELQAECDEYNARVASRPSGLDPAAAKLRRGVYRANGVLRRDASSSRRENDFAFMPALALDLDDSRGAHSDGLVMAYADHDAIVELLEGLPYPPSVILDSGGGTYPTWILDKPLALDSSQSRGECRSMLERLAHALTVLIGERVLPAGRQNPRNPPGIGVEGHDIPRVLRPPGLPNQKYHERIVSRLTGRHGVVRYSREDIADLLEQLDELVAEAIETHDALPPEQKVDPRPEVAAAPATIKVGSSRPDDFVLPKPQQWVADAVAELPGHLQEVYEDGVLVGWKPHVCPSCGGAPIQVDEKTGRLKHPDTLELGTAFIGASTGWLRCFRAQSCEAHRDQHRPGIQGMPFDAWAPRVLRHQALELAKARRRSLRPDADEKLVTEHQARANGDPSWPEISPDGDEMVELLGTWIDEAAENIRTLHLREVIGGAGKTHALAVLAARRTRLLSGSGNGPFDPPAVIGAAGYRGQTDFAVVFQDHEKAEAWTSDYRDRCAELGVEPRVRHVHGVGAKVRTDDGLVDACAKRDDWKAGGRAAQALVRRVLCRTCPLFRACEVTRPAAPGEIVVGVVAAVDSMRNAGFFDDRVVIFDEEPRATSEVLVPHQSVEALLTHRDAYGARVGDSSKGDDQGTKEERKARRIDAARDFGSIMAKVRDKALELIGPADFRQNIPFPVAFDQLEDTERARLLAAAKHLAGIPRSSLPSWNKPRGVREGDFIHDIGIEELWSAVTWSAHKENERATTDRRAQVRGTVIVNPDRSVVYAATRAASYVDLLRDRPRIVRVEPGDFVDRNILDPGQVLTIMEPPAGLLVLSATAQLSSEVLAPALPDGSSTSFGGARVKAAGGDIERLWCRHSHASRKRTCPKGRLAWKQTPKGYRLEAAKMLDTALAAIAEQLDERWDEVRGSVGVITYSPIAKALRDIGDTDDGRLVEAHRQLHAALEKHGATLAEDAVTKDGRPAVGWFGRHEAASNAFRECRVLVILGQPAPELSSKEREATVLDLPVSTLLIREEARLMRQAELRLRHIRRQERVIVAAVTRTQPPVEVDSWTLIRDIDQRMNGDSFRASVADLVHDARRGRVLLSQKPILAWLERRARSRDRSREESKYLLLSLDARRKLAQRTKKAAETELKAEGWESAKHHPGGRPPGRCSVRPGRRLRTSRPRCVGSLTVKPRARATQIPCPVCLRRRARSSRRCDLRLLTRTWSRTPSAWSMPSRSSSGCL